MQYMGIVAELQFSQFKLAAPLDIDHARTIDEDIVHRRIAEQGLQRPEANHFINDVGGKRVLLDLIQQEALLVGNFRNQFIDAISEFLLRQTDRDRRFDPHEYSVANDIHGCGLRMRRGRASSMAARRAAATVHNRWIRRSEGAARIHDLFAELEHDYPNIRLNTEWGRSARSPDRWRSTGARLRLSKELFCVALIPRMEAVPNSRS